MKKSVTQFDLSAAFKALDEMEYPKVEGGILPNRVDLKENFGSRKLRTDILVEDYYDVNDNNDLEAAAEEREGEVAKAKLARIEKIVDLDAESEDDLLTSYEGKVIIQCPQCMTLFYKNEEDLETDENNPDVVNINETCQHCGNTSGYMVIGKVAPVEEAELDNFDTEDFEEEPVEETEEEVVEEEPEEDLDDLDALDLDFDEEEPAEEEANESLNKAAIQKEVDKKHCSENDSKNLTLNEAAVAEAYTDYTIWLDDNGKHANEVHEEMIPYTKAYNRIFNYIRKLSPEDKARVGLAWIHNGNEEVIASIYAPSEGIDERVAAAYPDVEEDLMAILGLNESAEEELTEDKGEAAEQDKLQAKHEAPIEEAKKVCEKCGKEICECDKQELKESEVEDVINSVINSWDLGEACEGKDCSEVKDVVNQAASAWDSGDKPQKPATADNTKEIGDVIDSWGLDDQIPEPAKDKKAARAAKRAEKRIGKVINSWGESLNEEGNAAWNALSNEERDRYSVITNACKAAKEAGEPCPFAGGKWILYGVDKDYNPIETKELSATVKPAEAKRVRDELLNNNENIIGVYVSRMFKEAASGKAEEVELYKYMKFKPGFEDDGVEESLKECKGKDCTAEEAIKKILVKESLNKAEVQKEVDKKHCAENDSKNLTLNEAVAKIIVKVGDFEGTYNSVEEAIKEIEDWYVNYPDEEYAENVIYPVLCDLKAGEYEEDENGNQLYISESLKEAAEEKFDDSELAMSDEDVEKVNEPFEGEDGPEEVADEEAEENADEEAINELPVETTVGEVKEVAQEVAEKVAEPVEDEEAAEEQAEEIKEVVDEVVEDKFAEEANDLENEEEAEDVEVEAEEEAEAEKNTEEEAEGDLEENLKVISDFSEYKPWSGAVDTYDQIERADKLDELEQYLEEIYPDGMTATQINDILWFEGEDVLDYLGIAKKADDDEEVDEALTEDNNKVLSDKEFADLLASKEGQEAVFGGNLEECDLQETFDNIDDIDEKSFEESFTKALTDVYENVNNFKLKECSLKDNKLVVEGLINFKSGTSKTATCIFESAQLRKTRNEIILEGYSREFAKPGHFRLSCALEDGGKNLFAENLHYSYTIGKNLVEGYTRK